MEFYPDPVTKRIREKLKHLSETIKEYPSAHDIPLDRLGMHRHTLKELHAHGFTHMYNFVDSDHVLLKKELSQDAFTDLCLTIETLKQAYRNR